MPIWDRGSYSSSRTRSYSTPSYADIKRQDYKSTPKVTPKATTTKSPSYNYGSYRQADQKTIAQQKSIQTSRKTPTTNFRQADQKTIAQASVSRSSGGSSRSSSSSSGKTARTIMSIGADFIPVVGNIKSGIEAVTGKDYITGDKLSNAARMTAAAGIIAGGLGKGVIKGAGGVLKNLSKLRTTKQALNTARTVPIIRAANDTAKAVPVVKAATNTAQRTTSNVPQIIQKATSGMRPMVTRAVDAGRMGVQMGKQGIVQSAKDIGSAYGGVMRGAANVIRNNPGKAAAVGAVGGAYALTGPWGGQGGPATNPNDNTQTNIDPNTQSSLGSVSYGGGGGGFTPAPNNTMTPGAVTNVMPGANNMQPGMPPEMPPGMPQEMPPEVPFEMPPEVPFEMPPEIFEFTNEYLEAIRQAQQQSVALTATYLNQSLSQLDQMEAQIRQMFEAQGQGIDPATQAALAQIRQEVGLRRQQLMEEMNRRGLLQSGIWLEMENRILNNQLTSEERLLASRLSDIQNRMTDALMGLANQRLNIMGQYSQNAMQSQQSFNNMQLQAMQQMQAREDQWRQWQAQQNEARRQQQQEQARWNYEQQVNRAKQIADWTGTIPQGYPGAGQQTMDARRNLTTATGGTNNSLTNQYIQQVATYRDLQSALNEFNRYRPVMEQQGVNTQAVLNAIYGYFGQ